MIDTIFKLVRNLKNVASPTGFGGTLAASIFYWFLFGIGLRAVKIWSDLQSQQYNKLAEHFVVAFAVSCFTNGIFLIWKGMKERRTQRNIN